MRTISDNFEDFLIPSIEQASDEMEAAGDALSGTMVESKESVKLFNDEMVTFTDSMKMATMELQKMREVMPMIGTEDPHMPMLQHGSAWIPRTGPYWLHQGEAVMTAEQNRARNFAYRGGDMSLNVTFNVSNPDYVSEIRERLIPILTREMQGGPTGLREAIRLAYDKTAGAF